VTVDRRTALRLVEAATSEIGRAMKALGRRARGRAGKRRASPRTHPPLYHLSHLIRDEERLRLEARFGALSRDRFEQRRNCFTDVRVGSPKRDQVAEGGLGDNSREEESYRYVDIPIGPDIDAFRHALWHLTDARMREAEDAWLRKRAHELTYLDPHRNLDAIERLRPREDLRFARLPEIDVDRWRRYVVNASRVPKEHPLVKSSHVAMNVEHQTRIYVSGEGVRRIDRHSYWSLEVDLWLLSAKGDGLPLAIEMTVCDPEELPSPRVLARMIRDRIALLERLAAAPVVRSYSGPVLLEPVPAGLLIHEALGHRLEGNRLLSQGEGQTFRDSRGERVLPDFLTLRDDPRLAEFEGKSLVGHYRFDDEGVDAQDARLIVDGRLRGFLTSRLPIEKGHRSNGHGRARHHERPVSRMAVTILETSQGLSEDALRERLIEEVRRQGLPYGIRILHASGGETTTESYDFQAFLGEINVASRVYPDGREELIRGVNFVGTPLNAIRGIIAAGDRSELDNGWCGAESGFVPVSTVSPALLVSHLELQSKAETPYTQYAYPIPWG
jgi:predicted Zn-dependent protease